MRNLTYITNKDLRDKVFNLAIVFNFYKKFYNEKIVGDYRFKGFCILGSYIGERITDVYKNNVRIASFSITTDRDSVKVSYDVDDTELGRIINMF